MRTATMELPPLLPAPAPLTGPIARELVARYLEMWGTATGNAGEASFGSRNPAPQPVSLERSHLALLKERQYVVADKSDGVRMCLFLTRVSSGREHAVLVDRKLSVYQVPVAAVSRCFDGSLFDGELVWSSSGSHMFLVFDAVAWRGDVASVAHEPLPRRLELVRRVFDLGADEVIGADAASVKAKEGKVVCGGNAHGLSFRPKSCFPLEMLPTLLRQLPTTPYRVDGLILTPVDDPVRCGRHPFMYKFKWNHTLDLQANCATRELCVGAGAARPSERVPLPEGLCAAPDFWSALQDIMKPGDSPINLIVECSLEQQQEQPSTVFLQLEAIRRDKSHPNSLFTVTRTLQSFEDHLTLEELKVILVGDSAR